MDFMKVFDQTVREIKREVNLKVLKVPEIEQKVLDATDDVPWGPHGSDMAEIARATKKFTECSLVMNVLWTRLGEKGKDWRLVYKALAVIEYLVAHGSDRAVDDIIEHTFQISSLTSFEYVEPSGKDVGINVRKKAETIVALLNDKEKIQATRNKAAANRDKYVGLSSSGITHKSSSASYGGSSYQSSDSYGGFDGTRHGDNLRDSYKGKDRYGEAEEEDAHVKTRQGGTSDSQKSDQSSTHFHSKDGKDGMSKSSKKDVPPQYSSAPSSNYDDDMGDDFDPRGTGKAKSVAETSNQVDLFGESLIGDLMDVPTSIPAATSVNNGNSSDVDLFADADFVSVPPQAEKGSSSGSQVPVDLFASQPAVTSAVVPSTNDFFSAPESVVQPGIKTPKPETTSTNMVDPFAAVPMNNFEESDLFGAFTSGSTESTKNSISDPSSNKSHGNSATDSKVPLKKDSFQVKSGIWADSLSRGLIDLNISAPKKVSLVGVGVVGDLTEGLDEREKGPPASFYTGRAMGTGSGHGRASFTSSQAQPTTGGDFFSNFNSQQYQFGSFQK